MKKRDIRRFGRVHFISGNRRGTYPFCHSLFIDAQKPVLIDPSCDMQTLISYREAYPQLVVVNSHYHEDHFLYNGLFEQHPLWVHQADAPAFASIDKLFEFCGMQDETLTELWRNILIKGFRYKERTPDWEFVGGDVIDLGGAKMQVVGLPGHTPGHSGFYFEPDEVLFLGDIALTEFGPWYSDEASSIEDMISSVNKLKDMKARVYVTSHLKGIFEDISLELNDFLRVIEIRDEKILKFLRKPRGLEEIVNQWIVYGGCYEPAAMYEFSERGMINKHLNRLRTQGEIGSEDGLYFTRK